MSRGVSPVYAFLLAVISTSAWDDSLNAQSLAAGVPAVKGAAASVDSSYPLGPQDEITLWVLGMDEISDKPFRIDSNGYIDLPMIGAMRAGGMTVAQLKSELSGRLSAYVRKPAISVRVTESKSQPVSVLGAVNTPGVQQLNGTRSLVEVISLAGGLRPDAGGVINITRRAEWGRIPLDSAASHSSSGFSTAEVRVKSVLDGNSADNILIKPNDIISVARARTVYVIGEVPKGGTFVLNEREELSALEALSMAGGLNRTASARHAKILRGQISGGDRVEVPIDLKRILAGKTHDVQLRPDDILFVPGSTAKATALRAVEAGIQIGTGILIWRQ